MYKTPIITEFLGWRTITMYLTKAFIFGLFSDMIVLDAEFIYYLLITINIACVTKAIFIYKHLKINYLRNYHNHLKNLYLCQNG